MIDSTLERDGAAWADRKVRGTFRHDWDEHNFRFECERLLILLEEGVEDARTFVYEADTTNTTFDSAIQVPGVRSPTLPCATAARPATRRSATRRCRPERPASTAG